MRNYGARLANIESRLFAAQVHAMERLTTDELQAFVGGFERIMLGGAITPEEDAAKQRWLHLVRENLGAARPYDAIQGKLASRLHPSPTPPAVGTIVHMAPAPADVAPEPDPDAAPVWDYAAAKRQLERDTALRRAPSGDRGVTADSHLPARGYGHLPLDTAQQFSLLGGVASMGRTSPNVKDTSCLFYAIMYVLIHYCIHRTVGRWHGRQPHAKQKQSN